jgi:hypothetical protein
MRRIVLRVGMVGAIVLVTIGAQAQTTCPIDPVTGNAVAQMISPTNGSTLPPGAVTFEWCNASADYFLSIESVPGAHDIFFAFAGGPGAGVTSLTLGPACAPSPPTGCIPADGEAIYVTLYTLKQGNILPPSPFNYTFTAAGPTTTTTTSTPTTSTTTSTTTTTLAPCAPVTGAALTLRHILPPPGDDGLAFKGSFTVTPPVAVALDPVNSGVALRLVDGPTLVLDVQVAIGAYDTIARTGWKVNKSATRWTYVGPKTGAAGGITKVVLADKSSKVPGRVIFAVTGKAGSYAAGPQVRADLLLPAIASCVEATFPGVPPARPSCKVQKGSLLKCK